MSDEDGRDIALVGVCGAGKSTVGRLLRSQGWRVREIHQEHSYVPHMWRTIHRPQVLVYLDVTWDEADRRRHHPSYGPSQHADLVHRLRDARQHADIYLLTDGLTPEEVAGRVAKALNLLPRASTGIGGEDTALSQVGEGTGGCEEFDPLR